MNYQRLAFAQAVLREMSKEAGLTSAIGNMALNAGKAAIANPGKALTIGAGALGVGGAAVAGVQKAKAYNKGFDPAVQQQMATPIGY